MAKCNHDEKFRGVFGAVNGCVACQLEQTQVALTKLLHAIHRRIKELEEELESNAYPPNNAFNPSKQHHVDGQLLALRQVLLKAGGGVVSPPDPGECAKAIRVWLWHDAPPQYRALSRHGGDEDWVAFIPDYYVGSYLGWMEEGTPFGCFSVSEHPVDGGIVRIGAHA